jgi:signal peptidase I, archaeal type
MTVAHVPTLGARSVVHGLVLALTIASVSVAILVRAMPLTGRQTLVVAGPSMAPALPVGTAIVVEPVDPATLAVGDVVSLRGGPARAIFTHRIIRLVPRDGGLWLETKGDANPTADPSILPASDVMGRVAIAIPYVGYLVALASSPSGIVLIVALGLLLLMVGWVLDPKPTTDLATQAT